MPCIVVASGGAQQRQHRPAAARGSTPTGS